MANYIFTSKKLDQQTNVRCRKCGKIITRETTLSHAMRSHPVEYSNYMVTRSAPLDFVKLMPKSLYEK